MTQLLIHFLSQLSARLYLNSTAAANSTRLAPKNKHQLTEPRSASHQPSFSSPRVTLTLLQPLHTLADFILAAAAGHSSTMLPAVQASEISFSLCKNVGYFKQPCFQRRIISAPGTSVVIEVPLLLATKVLNGL